MSPKQFMDLLKNLQKRMKCPSCGETFRIEEVQFLGYLDGLFLLQMVCSNCGLPASMSIMNTREEIKPPLNFPDLRQKEQKRELGAITTDEQIEFHNFLEQFDGNFKDIL